jgi:hypothetical protein
MEEAKDAATVVIRNAGEMTKADRKAIADWLNMHAEWLIQDGKDYDRKFTGHYKDTRQ